jgi:hypothetical protein
MLIPNVWMSTIKLDKLFLRNPLPDLKWHTLDLPASSTI